MVGPRNTGRRRLGIGSGREDPAESVQELAPAYGFEMRRVGGSEVIGKIRLRVGNTIPLIMYAGHIGYGVAPDFRGHQYAARACRLIYSLARQHAMNELWITCNPENAASRRTCKLAGAEFVDTIDLPADAELYKNGDRQKCRYRIQLSHF